MLGGGPARQGDGTGSSNWGVTYRFLQGHASKRSASQILNVHTFSSKTAGRRQHLHNKLSPICERKAAPYPSQVLLRSIFWG